MFDIGFPELLLVSIVALLVIGPDKLPEAVRTVALWVGRIRRSLANIKAEIENEIGADEIRRQLHNESIMQELNKTKDQIGGIIRDAESQLSDIKDAATLDTPAEPEAEPPDNETTRPEGELPHNKQETPQDDDGRKQSESGR